MKPYQFYSKLFCAGFLFLMIASFRFAAAQTNVDNLTQLLDTYSTFKLDEWKVSPNLTKYKAEGNPYMPEFDDSDWDEIMFNEELYIDSCWVRKEIELPDEILGEPVKGKVELLISADDYGYVWINGKEKGYFQWDGQVIMTEKAKPGDRYIIAVKIINTAGPLRFMNAELNFQSAKEIQTKVRGLSLGMKTAQRLLSLETYQTNSRLKYDPGKDKSDISKDERTRLNELLQEAAAEIDADVLDYGETESFFENLNEVKSKLDQVKDFVKKFSLYFDANAHIDAAWLWREKETIEVCRNTFNSVFNVMDAYPGFTFTQSAAQYYDWMEKIYPEVFKKITDHISKNRWEVTGGMWVEPDCNLIDGISWNRHLLYGKNYFKTKFGRNVKVGWNPDSFGYNWNMPMFYKNAGIDAFITQKLGWNETNIFPHRVFWWESPDGSRILSYFPFDYVNTISQAYQLVDWLRQFEANTGFKKMMVLFGVGDHGGGPTKEMLERIETLKSIDLFPNVEYGTAEQYLNWLNGQNLSSLPVWKDELYLEYHQGTFTTQAKIKKYNRISEVLLTDTEKFSSMAKLFGGRYYSADIDTAWKYTMFNQFHDILPGSSIREVYADAEESYHDVFSSGNFLLKNSLSDLTKKINTLSVKSGKALIVFNSLAWERTDLVTVELETGDFNDWTIQNTKGKQIPSQVLSNGRYGRKIIFIAEAVPGLGYKTFVMKKVKGPYLKTSLRASENNLENEFFRVTINPSTGFISSLVDKRNNKEILASDGNELQLLEDKPSAWEAWNLGLTGIKYPMRFDKLEIIESGPVRAVVRAYFSYLKPGVKKDYPTPDFPSSFFYQDIILYSGIDRIDFRTTADWHEEKTMLKAAFAFTVKDTSATFEIPYGTIKRPTKRETNWQKARYEVPAIRWADLSDDNYGISLLNNCKYGYDVTDNVLRLSLLRSPKWPDRNADMGKHEMDYALYPHTGNWKSANTVKKGYEFNTPLIPFISSEIHGGELPAEKSLTAVSPENLILTSIKKAQESDALIIQWYESAGEDTEAVLTLPKKPKKVFESDFLEGDGEKINVTGNAVKIKTGKNSVKTIKVYF